MSKWQKCSSNKKHSLAVVLWKKWEPFRRRLFPISLKVRIYLSYNLSCLKTSQTSYCLILSIFIFLPLEASMNLNPRSYWALMTHPQKIAIASQVRKGNCRLMKCLKSFVTYTFCLIVCMCALAFPYISIASAVLKRLWC